MTLDNPYRYILHRIWDNTKPLILFIGLNPSTADEFQDDKTITKCIKFVKRWEVYGGFYMTNLFAYRATSPIDMKLYKEPIGILNDEHIIDIATRCDKIVFAWGNNGQFMNRDKEVIKLFPKAYCIEISKKGNPKHPLYLNLDLELIRFKEN